MKKKIIYIVAALIILVGLAVGFKMYQDSKKQVGDKSITIEIMANDVSVFKGVVETNTETLGELLKSMAEATTIVLDYEDGAYGMYIKGLGKDELIMEDKNQGLFWVYESVNNESCLASGFCDAANTLAIQDQNSFVFKLTKFE